MDNGYPVFNLYFNQSNPGANYPGKILWIPKLFAYKKLNIIPLFDYKITFENSTTHQLQKFPYSQKKIKPQESIN